MSEYAFNTRWSFQAPEVGSLRRFTWKSRLKPFSPSRISPPQAAASRHGLGVPSLRLEVDASPW